jgi:hypothetical protein
VHKTPVAISFKERYYKHTVKNAIIVQTFSPQSTINSLPIPQKSVAFLKNPLERPELEPSPNHPMMVEPQSVTPVNSVWEKHLPFSWKTGAVAEIQNDPPLTDTAPLVSAQNKNVLATPTRRKLPDEIKAIFETNSSNFVAYAKNGVQEKTKIMDEWDKALLLGEYPAAALERQKPKRVSFISPLSLVPQKSSLQESGTTFPSRVMDDGVASPVPPRTVTTPVIQIKPVSAVPNIPKKPQNILGGTAKEVVPKKEGVLIFTSAIPTKPKQPPADTTLPANDFSPSIIPKAPLPSSGSPVLAVPLSPKVEVSRGNIAPANSSIPPPPNMSETLVEKIIEGQMRGVFENAPPLLQKELEKTAVREIMSAADEKGGGGNIENEVWKKRLREYLTKLHEQAVSVFSDIGVVNPTEGELVLDYVKRVYPILLKAQVMKQ